MTEEGYIKKKPNKEQMISGGSLNFYWGILKIALVKTPNR
jgi:hypothetical protein